MLERAWLRIKAYRRNRAWHNGPPVLLYSSGFATNVAPEPTTIPQLGKEVLEQLKKGDVEWVEVRKM
jgi:hypothetical protein